MRTGPQHALDSHRTSSTPLTQYDTILLNRILRVSGYSVPSYSTPPTPEMERRAAYSA